MKVPGCRAVIEIWALRGIPLDEISKEWSGLRTVGGPGVLHQPVTVLASDLEVRLDGADNKKPGVIPDCDGVAIALA